MGYKIVFISLFFSLFFHAIYPQGEINDQAKIFYRNEKTLGLLLNSNGYGLGGRYATQINAKNKKLYSADLVFFKHPKEVKTTIYPSYKGFVQGKLNTFFTIRTGIGYQHEVYRKIDKGGISIRYYYDFGPSIGMYKPVYYYIVDLNNTQQTYPDKYDPTVEQTIIGKYSFFKGLSEIKVNPGVYAKIGFCFEYSPTDNVIHAIETGIVADVFLSGVPIMAHNNANFFYPAIYASYRFGKVVDAQFSARKRKQMAKEMELNE